MHRKNYLTLQAAKGKFEHYAASQKKMSHFYF